MLLFSYLPGARVRVGLDRSGGAYFLTHPVAYNPKLHEVEKNFACLEKLGVTGRGELPEMFPWKQDEESAERTMKECRTKRDGFVLITPGARVKVKSWPENKYIELGKKLAAKYGVKILLAGSKGDGAVCSAISAGIGKDACDVSGRLGLLALRCMMDRAKLVLGSDSGTMHIAATSRTPIVCLFGPTDPVQYRPYTDRAILVQNKIDCSPCLHVDCDLTDDGWGKCMHSIEVGQVLEAVHKALEG
jgi:ADP-heptose:LPS heptosyltransferase